MALQNYLMVLCEEKGALDMTFVQDNHASRSSSPSPSCSPKIPKMRPSFETSMMEVSEAPKYPSRASMYNGPPRGLLRDKSLVRSWLESRDASPQFDAPKRPTRKESKECLTRSRSESW